MDLGKMSPGTVSPGGLNPGKINPDRMIPVNAPRQNIVGDVVVSSGGGEIVLLPRLWNFELVVQNGETSMQTEGGLVASLGFGDEVIAVQCVTDAADRSVSSDGIAHVYRRAS